MSRVLLAGRFDPGDPSSGARLEAFAGALHGVTVDTTAPPSLADPLGLTPVDDALRRLVPAIERSDVVVIAGGDAFDAAPGAVATPALHTAAVVGVARAARRPVALVGVGADRIEGRVSRALARFVVRSADLLVLRDEPSAATLHRAGAAVPVRVAADPVWCALRLPAATTVRDGFVVVIHDAASSRSVLGELARALGMLASATVTVLPWRHTDVGSASVFVDMLPAPARVLRPLPTLAGAMRAFGSFGVVVSMHEHASIAAAAAGTPTMAVGQRRSLIAVARQLGHDLVDRPIGDRALAELVERAAGSHPSLAPVRHEQALAEGSMALLRLLVDRGNDLDLAEIDGLALSDGRSA
jgi:polysaccharide pyruvyl transferase WcaK-like protein